MRSDNAVMKRPFQFSLKTLMCVSAMICAEVWYLTRWAARNPPQSSLAEAIVFLVALVLFSVLLAL